MRKRMAALLMTVLLIVQMTGCRKDTGGRDDY